MSEKKRNRARRREPAAGNAARAAELSGSTNSSAAAASIDRHLPALFLALGLLLGTLYALMMPPLQIADEMMHFARVYSVSRGVCVASPDIDMPVSFAQLNDLFPHWLEKYRKISIGDLRQALQLPLNDRDMAGDGRRRSLDGFINQNVYHCAPYLPEAAVLNAGRHAALSPLALMYLCRLTNLVFYVLLTYLALRLLPDFRIVLFCTALMPMALHQAASVSVDSTLFAVSFLFSAYVFHLAFAKEPERLGPRHYVILALLILFLVLTKSMICAVFLLLLIPGASFPSRRSRWLMIAGYFLLAIAGAVLWQHVNEPNMRRQAEERMAGLVDVAANMRFMREHPMELAAIFLRSLADLKYFYFNLQEFVGKLGWLAIQLPDWLVCAYAALLLAAAATQTRATRLTPLVRGLVLAFAAAAVANTFAAGWIVETQKPILDTPALWPQARAYAQGRYWIPYALPMLVLFSTGRTRFNPRYFAAIAVAIVLLASAVAFYWIGSTYYL
jgi:uncharacterized membrane protein